MEVWLGLVRQSDRMFWFAWPSPGMTVGPESPSTLKSTLLRTTSHTALVLVLGLRGRESAGESPFIAKGN